MRAAAALVEERVELDDIEGTNEAAVVQHLHDEMRLAVGQPSGHGGSDARGDRGVERVDVEADVHDTVFRAHPIDEMRDLNARAEFVEAAHVDNVYAALGKQAYAYDYEADPDDSVCFSCSWALIMDRGTYDARPSLHSGAKLLRPVRKFRTWTDDFSNMFSILR